jgi:hypothetical protein
MAPWLFSLFFHEINSERGLVFRGSPGLPTIPQTQEQRDGSLFFRCSPLFLVE